MGGGITSRPGKHSRQHRGASLVEFALIAPVVFSLLLGMFTGGMSLSRQNSMQNAVREGSRLGATVDEDANWAAAVRTRVVSLSGGDLVNDDVCVKLVKRESATSVVDRQSTSCTAELAADEPPDADIPVGHCAVVVWAGRNSDFNVVFFTRVLELRADAINRYERPGDGGECSTS